MWISMSLRQNLVVKIVAGYVAGSFVLMEILWFIWCRPFHNYWAVPPPDRKSEANKGGLLISELTYFPS
jgi:hypothetical protein